MSIQDDNINDTRTYLGKNIKVGRNVTATKPEGNVLIDGANMVIWGGGVVLKWNYNNQFHHY